MICLKAAIPQMPGTLITWHELKGLELPGQLNDVQVDVRAGGNKAGGDFRCARICCFKNHQDGDWNCRDLYSSAGGKKHA